MCVWDQTKLYFGDPEVWLTTNVDPFYADDRDDSAERFFLPNYAEFPPYCGSTCRRLTWPTSRLEARLGAECVAADNRA